MVKDYQLGKIYKIYSLNGTVEDVYYGSTIVTLSRRMAKHRVDYKQLKNKKGNCTSCALFDKYDDCIIELVENYPCNSVEELKSREGYYQRNNPCVNKKIEGRTIQQWYEDNKERLLKKSKELYKKNKEITLQKAKEKITCECGSEYNKMSKSRHERSQKHITKMMIKNPK